MITTFKVEISLNLSIFLGYIYCNLQIVVSAKNNNKIVESRGLVNTSYMSINYIKYKLRKPELIKLQLCGLNILELWVEGLGSYFIGKGKWASYMPSIFNLTVSVGDTCDLTEEIFNCGMFINNITLVVKSDKRKKKDFVSLNFLDRYT